MVSEPVIIAIDGPAAGGKGTLARHIAEYYNYAYLDSGKLYRLVAFELLRENKPLTIENAASTAQKFSAEIPFHLMSDPNLTNDEVSKAAAIIAAFNETRQALKGAQKSFAKQPYAIENNQKIPKNGAVIDGRDIGTVICPNAQAKLFITADINVRAKRRLKDLKNTNYNTVLADLQKRDSDDSNRSIAPLKQAHDAITIDTSSVSIENALQLCLNALKNKLNKPN